MVFLLSHSVSQIEGVACGDQYRANIRKHFGTIVYTEYTVIKIGIMRFFFLPGHLTSDSVVIVKEQQYLSFI